jgi:hypothetical protein
MRSCGLIVKRVLKRKCVIVAGIKDGMVRACGMVAFLAKASYRSVTHRHHVDVSVMGLISSVYGNPPGLRRSHTYPLAPTSATTSAVTLKAVPDVPSVGPPTCTGKGHASPDHSP